MVPFVTGRMMTNAHSGPRHQHSGRRRSHVRSQRRGLATWVWVTPLTILLAIGLVFGWLSLSRDSRDSEAKNATTTCFLGDLTLIVWSDPTTQETARDLAEKYSLTTPAVRDYCILPRVEVKDTIAAINGYRAESPGAAAVWLPDTSQIGIDQISTLPGGPANPPIVAETPEGQPVPLVIFGSSPSVSEDAARAGADMLRVIAPPR